jgi:FlhB-like protein
MTDKTEEPTPQKLRKAQESGESGASATLSQALGFLVAASLLPAALGALAAESATLLRAALTAAAQPTPEIQGDALPRFFATHVVRLTLPLVMSVAVTGGVATFVQTGGVFATKKLVPDLARLNPISGVQSWFSLQRIYAVLRAFAFAALVGYLAYQLGRHHMADVAHLAGRPEHLTVFWDNTARALVSRTALIGLALGVIDALVTRRSFMQRMRMSKDEVKREHKESDGDPEMKAARERAHHEMLEEATLAQVKRATVIIVNPTHKAAALRYQADEDQAPVVVCSGEGNFAERIKQRAREYGIPILRDVDLARALMDVEVGQEIPEALYEAVAEILRDLEAEPK